MPVAMADGRRVWQWRTQAQQWAVFAGWFALVALFVFCWQLMTKDQIWAFVYDAPLLRYLVRKGDAKDLRLLPGTFGRQDYGIALKQGSEMRESIDIALLRQIRSSEWHEGIAQTLGQRD